MGWCYCLGFQWLKRKKDIDVVDFLGRFGFVNFLVFGDIGQNDALGL